MGYNRSMEPKIHSNEECGIKCEALKTILTQIQQNAAMDNNYSIR